MSLLPVRLSDMQLATCTRWVAPSNAVFLELAHTISLYQQFTANQAPVPDLQLSTPPEYDFVCKVVSYTGLTPGTLIQIQWPDGRYLSNPGIDAFSFLGVGRRGRLLANPKVMRPSSKIRITVDNSAVGSLSPVELHFEGVIRVPMVQS